MTHKLEKQLESLIETALKECCSFLEVTVFNMKIGTEELVGENDLRVTYYTCNLVQEDGPELKGALPHGPGSLEKVLAEEDLPWALRKQLSLEILIELSPSDHFREAKTAAIFDDELIFGLFKMMVAGFLIDLAEKNPKPSLTKARAKAVKLLVDSTDRWLRDAYTKYVQDYLPGKEDRWSPQDERTVLH